MRLIWRSPADEGIVARPAVPQYGAWFGASFPEADDPVSFYTPTDAERATAFAAETPPAREVLAESRTLKGTGAAGAATVGAAGVEVAQDLMTEAQGAVLSLVPYLDALRWVFIALALGGIGIAVWTRLDDWRKGRR